MVPNLKSHRSGQAPKKLSRSASSHGTSRTAPNGQPKKKSVICRDLKLHMLISKEGGLLNGTEMTYCDNGKPLLKGYKAGSRIFCYHCSEKISPSEFEKHAAEKSGKQPHKKPYSYIQLENGLTLHQLALYLWKISSVVDNGNSSASEKGLLYDECLGFFHKDSSSLPMNTPAEWQCGFCRRKYTEQNSDASESRRVAEVHPIIKTDECATCVVGKNGEAGIVCALTVCSGYKNCDCLFSPLALITCLQCEKQFHVRCLKEHGNSDLKEKPKGKWFCSFDCDSACENIFSTLESFIIDGGEENIKDFFMEDKRSLNIPTTKAVRWRLLCAKSTYNDDQLLSDATSIFYENFLRVGSSVSDDDLLRSDDDLIQSDNDLIRDMVYGKKGQSRRMYCAVVTVGSTVVAAALFRVLGQDLAELPLAATAKANQRKGYLRLLISYLEKLLMLLNVRSFVLPATKNSKDMWKEKFGFEDMSSQQQKTYEENCWNMLEFPDTFMLHKVIAKNSKDDMEKSDRGRESI
ncbi:PHD-type domain-containing protein [Heracleum sosnowskyi]|uniref:PHD-type domain-containing protein n=1 Tax=Heracleum sosnowskyi TaxID=360622 RepID=A0AAD8NA78_9APIA|nr:PHD-type domain-containing protein [Heracleum sosnowskyi]